MTGHVTTTIGTPRDIWIDPSERYDKSRVYMCVTWQQDGTDKAVDMLLSGDQTLELVKHLVAALTESEKLYA